MDDVTRPQAAAPRGGPLSVLADLPEPVGPGSARAILDTLPAAVYTTDAEGRIAYHNEAAARLWGRMPDPADRWCGSWKLFWPDGRTMAHGDCPMAMAVKQARPVRGIEAAVERPDGTRVPFLPYATPLFAEAGIVAGAVNILVDISDRKRAEVTAQRLAAIVESSDDAIVSKDLNGIIASWNRGAERLFGYTASEVIGRPVTILIPPERHDEEPFILDRIRRGERVDHYETVRRRKDGALLDISLSVSPVKDANGVIVGAAKIARDITERRRAQEQRDLLLREMNHRVKNLFALAGSVVALSARRGGSAEDLARTVRARLGALARAHALTVSGPGMPPGDTPLTLHTLIAAIVEPYAGDTAQGRPRIAVRGADLPLSTQTVTAFALLLHEFATNAAKYGALSVPDGYVEIEGRDESDGFALVWTEHGGPPVAAPQGGEGFGTLLSRATVEGQLRGEIERAWKPDGLVIRLTVPRAQTSD